MSLYVSLFFGLHDSGAAFASEDRVLLCLQAERVFRKKHMRATPEQMEHLVLLGLQQLRKTVYDIDTLMVSRWGCTPSRFVTVLGRSFAPLWTGHHANHVGLARSLGWSSALAVCADGGSENGCTGIYLYDGKVYEPVADLDRTLLTGRFYGTLTQLVIGGDLDQAHVQWPGKTMGVSAFGRYDERLAAFILDNADRFGLLRASDTAALAREIGLDSHPDTFDWHRWNLAHTAQRLWEDLWIEQLAKLSSLSENLILAGGCALNVLLNARIRRSGLFSHFFVPPSAGDDGQALGALLHQLGVSCAFPYLGRTWGHARHAPLEAAEDLAAGRIVFWFDGRSEVGPRALGHRSILGIPSTVAMRRRLSEEVKQREWYRPVAPIVLAEDAADWFDTSGDSPWMLEAVPAKARAKAYAPAVVHVDGTCRLQTLAKHDDPVLHGLIRLVREMTGCPVLMNTSMNLPGEAICDSPDDARHTFLESGADALYICGKRYTRASIQPASGIEETQPCYQI